MYQVNEIVNILFDVAAVLVFVFLTKDNRLPKFRLIYLSVLFIVLSHVFTIVEGFWLGGFFNFLEHLCFGLSGISFAAGIFAAFTGSPKESPDE